MSKTLTEEQKKLLEKEREENPAEVSFFELLNYCGAYKEQKENGK